MTITQQQAQELTLARARLKNSIAWLRDGIPVTNGIGVADMVVIEAALHAFIDRLSADSVGAEPVARVVGFDPVEPTKGAHLPMIPSSWRFGFWRANGGLEFRRLDEGAFVIWDSVKDAVFASMAKLGDWPEDFGHENGQYLCSCCECKRTFTAHKRRVVCKVCALAAPSPAPAVPSADAADKFLYQRHPDGRLLITRMIEAAARAVIPCTHGRTLASYLPAESATDMLGEGIRAALALEPIQKALAAYQQPAATSEPVAALIEALTECYGYKSYDTDREGNIINKQRNVAAFHPLIAQAIAALAHQPAAAEPIDMVLHCPACGLQHIDAPEFNSTRRDPFPSFGADPALSWTNPPHRSHLCHGCGHVWRPADVPTNGVVAVKTTGKADSPIVQPAASQEGDGKDVARLDWLESRQRIEAVHDGRIIRWSLHVDHDLYCYPGTTLREAIDAARDGGAK